MRRAATGVALRLAAEDNVRPHGSFGRAQPVTDGLPADCLVFFQEVRSSTLHASTNRNGAPVLAPAFQRRDPDVLGFEVDVADLQPRASEMRHPVKASTRP